MKNNKYQITGIKGRLLHLGFVLLIVLLYACDGGYVPSVQDDSIKFDLIESEGDSEPQTLKVTVYIPSQINDKDMYKVTCVPDISPPSPFPDEISKTETYTFTIDPAITYTITVYIATYVDDDRASPPNYENIVATASYPPGRADTEDDT
jgi:hypothetical protein